VWRIPWIDHVHPEKTKSQQIVSGTVGWKLEVGTYLHKKEVGLAIFYLYIICVLRSFQMPSIYVRRIDFVMIMIFPPPSCRCIILLMYKTQWKKCIDLVDGERTNSQVLSKLQCLIDVISRRRCSSRAAIFTYLPAGLQFEYVAGAQWFHKRICAHWLSDWNCRHRMEDRFIASGKTLLWSCAPACVISFKEIPSEVFIDHHSSRAR
jgi:hypothetical protein